MEWYYKVGSIFAQTLVLIGISPVLDCVYTIFLGRLKQYLDIRRFKKPNDNEEVQSTSKTVSKFIATYSGPEMLIHHRYATILVNIFICMIFGVGLPILFPIVLFNLCVMYCLDRLLTVYLFKQPPLFD